MAMGLWAEQVVPRITNRVLASAQHQEIRQRVCSGLTGEVVEIGFGSGLNVVHYPDAVRQVTAVEPSDVAWRLSEPRRRSAPVPVVRAGVDGQRLPFEDATFDSALSTWTMCTIPDAVAALRELARVLRPGGQLLFVEHGAAPDASVLRWQKRIEPVQRRVFAGCHLSRPVDELLVQAGLRAGWLNRYYVHRQPRPFAHLYEGCSVATSG